MENNHGYDNKYEIREKDTQQNDLIYAGLIGVGLIIVQDFIALEQLDLTATISVFAFAVSIPLLATLVILNHLQASYKYASYPAYLILASSIGILGAIVGVVAAFWHVSWIAGVLCSVSGVLGLLIYSSYYSRLERDNKDKD